MKLKRIWGTILVIGVVCLAICLLPWPSRIDVDLPGVETAADGTVKNDITVNVEGWYLKYIFLQDRLQASIQIRDSEKEADIFVKMDAPAYDERGTEIWSTAPYYEAETDRYEVMDIAFTDAMNTFVLKRSASASVYVAASNVEEELPEILKKFDFILG